MQETIKQRKSSHRLYATWNMMMQRCYNPNYPHRKDYMDRGIIVCERWHDFYLFIEDMSPTYQENLTMDRINNDGNYELSNCRWATRNVQSRNNRLLINSNTSGYRGASFKKKKKKWYSQIQVNKKVIHLGIFSSAIDAAIARDKYVIQNNLEHTLNFPNLKLEHKYHLKKLR